MMLDTYVKVKLTEVLSLKGPLLRSLRFQEI